MAINNLTNLPNYVKYIRQPNLYVNEIDDLIQTWLEIGMTNPNQIQQSILVVNNLKFIRQYNRLLRFTTHSVTLLLNSQFDAYQKYINLILTEQQKLISNYTESQTDAYKLSNDVVIDKMKPWLKLPGNNHNAIINHFNVYQFAPDLLGNTKMGKMYPSLMAYEWYEDKIDKIEYQAFLHFSQILLYLKLTRGKLVVLTIGWFIQHTSEANEEYFSKLYRKYWQTRELNIK